uniref:CUB_2 domain-containing protein n=1 Tax=Caenorhabditis tropicalis TaxID=1561998 RepID=A0A1I7TLP8_9PELO
MEAITKDSLKMLPIFLFILAHVSASPVYKTIGFDNIVTDNHISFDIKRIFVAAQHNNQSIYLSFRSDHPIRYQFAKCNQILMSTGKEISSHEVTFYDEWISWMYNVSIRTCSTGNEDTYQLELRLYPTVPTSGLFVFSTIKKIETQEKFNGFPVYTVVNEASQTSVYYSSVAHSFSEVSATEGKTVHLISDLSTPATVTFGKCDYEIPKHFDLQTSGDIVMEQEDLSNINSLANICCSDNNRTNVFQMFLTSAENSTGAFILSIVGEEDNFDEHLIKVSLVAAFTVGFIFLVICFWKCMSWIGCCDNKDNKKSEIHEMKSMRPRCESCGEDIEVHLLS